MALAFSLAPLVPSCSPQNVLRQNVSLAIKKLTWSHRNRGIKQYVEPSLYRLHLQMEKLKVDK